MNSLELDALKIRILAHLQNRGATKCDTLASELGAAHASVLLALEELSSPEKKAIQPLPFGLWDVSVQADEAA